MKRVLMAVFVVLLSVIKMSVASVFGVAFQGDAIRNSDIIIGMLSLMVMVLCNLWGHDMHRITANV